MAISNKILVVEDDPTTVLILRSRLAKAGFWTIAPEVTGDIESFTAKVAKIAAEEDIHIAICDLTLPLNNKEGILNGLAILSALRQVKTAKPFIIVLTGTIDEAVFESLKAYKVKGSFSKENPSAYDQVIKTAIELKEKHRFDRDEEEDKKRENIVLVNFEESATAESSTEKLDSLDESQIKD
ncbi:MAG: response regulator [Bdellovibrionota bacterium]